MGSTRLPGKALTLIKGKPMLAHVVRRVQRARSVDATVVATTTAARDDEIVDFCRAQKWDVFRGSEEDVLDRYRTAARELDADVVVRVTSDCPRIDPRTIDKTIHSYV